MIRRYGQAIRLALMVLDGGLAILLSLTLYQVFAHPNAPTADFLSVFWLRAIFYGIGWVVLLYIHGAYRLRAHWTVMGEVSAVARATFWLTLLGIAALFLSASDVQGSGWALVLFPVQGVLAIGVRCIESHVERLAAREREAAPAGVEMVRTETEIEQNAVGVGEALGLGDPTESRKAGVHDA